MKVLVAGVGSIGQRHIRNLRALLGSDVEILAYRVRRLPHVLTEDMDIEPGRTVEEAYGLRTYTCLDRALAEEPAAVLVCNPSSVHLQVALAAARAGCHVLIEKPLSHSYDDVDDLAVVTEGNGLVAMVGYQMRFHPGLQRLKALLEHKAIGHVLSARIEVTEHLPSVHPYEDYRQSYAARADLGGGVVLSYIHELDYIYWLFGLPRQVFAVGGHLSDLEIDVEDTADVTMECFVDGTPVAIHLHQDFVQCPPRRRCEVVGDEGKIVLDLTVPSLTVTGRLGGVLEQCTFEGFQRNQLFMAELKHFLACLAGQAAPTVTVRDGAQSLRMALAAKESISSGRAVRLS